MSKLDYIIVGQGITGTCLALMLEKRGKSVKIVDNSHRNSSTVLAAGMINPVTGRKYVKSWMIDTLMPFAIKFYSEFESELDVSILHKTLIKRNMPTVRAVNDWMARCQDANYDNYLDGVDSSQSLAGQVYSEFGYGTIKNALRIDLPKLLLTSKESFQEKGMLTEQEFNYKNLISNADGISYDDVVAERIIFCEGYKAIANPFFGELPFTPVKGEVIELKIPHLNIDFVLRHERFLVPLGGDRYWTGGGYDNNDLTELPTENFMQKLKQDLDAMLTCKYEVLSHKAGIRPAIKDRKPILGSHAQMNNIYICNGMGTKGASLAPYFCNHLIEHIEEGKMLLPEVDIARFQD